MSDEKRESGGSGELRDDSPESEPIKVTDRRKFHSSGDLRESVGEPQEVAAESIDPPSTVTPPGPATPSPPAAAASPPHEKPAGGPTTGAAAPGQEPLDLRFFVYDLYMSALQMLGVPTQAGAPAGTPDLERARYFVEFLQVLGEKTKGNLAPGEERMLKDVLYDLRMKFVDISSKGPA